MYTFKTSERNNEKATEFETKSLLYLMTAATNSENVDLFIIDCFNDVTGLSADASESWDVQSKGVANLTPKKIGNTLYTLFSNYVSDIDFSHYILFLQSFSEEYLVDSSKELFGINNFKDKYCGMCLSIRNCIKRASKSTVPGQHRFGFEKPRFCSL